MIGDQEIRGKLNVVEAIDQAIQRTRYLLFDPVLYTKWINFGVMIFLSVMFAGGGGFSYAFQIPSYLQGVNYEDALINAETYILENLFTVLSITIPIVTLVSIIMAALMYVRVRGTMMVIRAVAYNDEGIGENWQAVGVPTWSYFVFKLELAIAATVYFFVAGLVGALLVRQQMFEDVSTAGLAVGLVVITLVSTFVWIAYALTLFVMHNFIAPLMFHFNFTCGEAWGRFFEIARDNPAQTLFFLLLKIVYSFVFGTVSTFALYCTCCLGGLPVIGQTLLAPLYVFERAYSLYVIGTVGSEYAIVQEPPPPEPPMLPPAIDAPPSPDINR
jgi:hypothetical protein